MAVGDRIKRVLLLREKNDGENRTKNESAPKGKTKWKRADKREALLASLLQDK